MRALRSLQHQPTARRATKAMPTKTPVKQHDVAGETVKPRSFAVFIHAYAETCMA